MAKNSHIHKLKRIKFKSGNAVYFCCLPDCTFKINVALSLGKRSICWRCGESFIMNDYSIRLAKPHCEGCHKPKDASSSEIEAEESHEAAKEIFVDSSPQMPSLSERLQQMLNKNKTSEITEEDI